MPPALSKVLGAWSERQCSEEETFGKPHETHQLLDVATQPRLLSRADPVRPMAFPVVDFSAFAGAQVPPRGEKFVASAEQQAVGAELLEILTSHGFVYAAGLLSSEDIAAAFRGSRELFAEGTDRSRLPRLTPQTNTGYSAFASEALNMRRERDLKEAFNVRKGSLEVEDETPAAFRAAATRVWEQCCRGAQQVLLAFGVALQLQNPAAFVQTVNRWDLCTLRFNHYPATSGTAEDGAAIPCGEHTDFGAVTLLLLEDGVPGLEARTSQGWTPAAGRQGALLLNTGAMLARWCNDRVKATPHRVVPTCSERFSIAFFCDPDRGELVEVLPEFTQGTKPLYEPILAEASQGLFQATKSVACGDSGGRSAHQGSASSSSEGSWGIEDDTRETGEAVVPRLTLRAPTMADAMSLEQALHAENSILEREVARQRAEIQELKKKRSHAPQEPRVAVGGTTSRSTSSRSGSKTPAQGGAGSVPVPRFVPRAAGSTTCTMQRSPQSPRVMQGVATPVCSPRGEVPSRLCAYLPTNGWVYAAPASSQAQTPRTSAAPVRTAVRMRTVPSPTSH
ncbi:unnamed protein product [Effrenium voratum]|nr:unnamed protein product [Effrenium voratum]